MQVSPVFGLFSLLLQLHEYFTSRYIYLPIYSEGEEWQQLRSAVSRGILKPSALVSHVDSMHQVVLDFIDKMKISQRQDGVVADIETELYKWALECKYWVGLLPGGLLNAPISELPYTRWPLSKWSHPTLYPMISLFAIFLLNDPFFWLFSATRSFKFSQSCYKNGILVICFGSFPSFLLKFSLFGISCSKWLLFYGFLPQWPPFCYNLYWMTPFFKLCIE